MRHSKRFLCDLCFNRFNEAVGYHCPQCDIDADELRDLYEKVLLERPHLRGLTMPKLFAKMYESLVATGV